MATAPIKLRGKFSGLALKVKGKKGTETISFNISSNERSKWDRLVAHAEQDVEISMVPLQDELPGIGDKAARGVKRGSKAAEGSHQAQD